MQIDWSGIRAAAISFQSVRAAAIQAASNLPPDEATRLIERINKRAYRERWIEKANAMAANKPTTALPLSKNVQTGSQAIANKMAELESETRLSLAKYGRKAARESETAGLKDAPLVHKAAQVAGIVHRWGDQGGQGQSFTLNVLNLGSLGVQVRQDNESPDQGVSE